GQQQAILEEYQLKQHQFFFYPAQFWAHKNHTVLLAAFAQLLCSYPDYQLVLTGSDKGNKSYIQSLATQLGIESNIRFVGFVAMETINTLYRNAAALVMPTYLGPTNMPLIEAMELDCPVVCSDLKGHREMMGDAAIYFDPSNKEELYQSLSEVIKNRRRYLQNLKQRKKTTPFRIDFAMQQINEALKAVAVVRETWQ
ncbi:MAG: glycosyltransferase, partial [Dysgonamonadaceae bacterium]|nr:glycosyltransferase [Dysgonamonadaceae bacterium]